MKALIIVLVFGLSLASFAQAESENTEKLKNYSWSSFKDYPASNFVETDAKYGPRFEGWYTRITDRDGKRSMAFIVGSFLHKGELYMPWKPMPGYVAVLINDEIKGTLKVFETFPDETNLSVNGQFVFNKNPLEDCEDDDCQTNFSWSAPGFGHVDEQGFNLRIPGEIKIKGKFSNPIYWNNDIKNSPEGMASEFSFVPIHWYVHSLGSKTNFEYEYENGNIKRKSSGYAHIEKNWGRSFPKKWIWSEGITENNSSHYALGGGEVKIGAIAMNSFLVGFRTPKISWDFKPQQGTVFKTFINACQGSFTMVIARFGKQLVIDSSADKKTFSRVSIPTERGFVQNGAEESFSAKTTIEAFAVDLKGRSTLVEKKTFHNAALEFGGKHMCGGFNGF